MCQMRIVLQRGSDEETILENAALLEATDRGLVVNALFEEPKLIEGAVVSRIDFLQGKVMVRKIERKA